MRVQQFLEHHGIAENPFGQEDAQSDHVFRQHLLSGAHHPAWDKIFGNPDSPSTSVVFGEKGSGKTALRLQITEHLKKHNRENAQKRAFIIEYDDFNPYLDTFRERLHGRKHRPERALRHWRLWDHMDSILSLGVTRLVREVSVAGEGNGSSEPTLVRPSQLERLSRLQKRDLLLLAAFYDHTYEQPPKQRWHALRKKLKYSTWRAHWDLGLGIVVTLATIALVWRYAGFSQLGTWWAILIFVLAWAPWGLRQVRLLWTAWRVKRQVRVFDHQVNTLRQILSHFPRQEIFGQPVPSKDRSDDRYELIYKLQQILAALGFSSIVVLIDRVDEPHLINGSPERMRDFLWPIFDNKFLKHPGTGFKLLLPSEVVYYIQREEKAFFERSRLDKQNVIYSLVWTGESLYDVANDRVRACAKSASQPPTVRDLFEDSITKEELIAIFGRLRVPRHLFKFLYRLIVDHCNRYTEDTPAWTISRDTMQATLALYMRDLEAFDRGMGPG